MGDRARLAPAVVVALALAATAAPAGAQSTGGAMPVESAPRLSAPPPGVKLRPAPAITSWRCLRDCVDARSVRIGSILRLRGDRLRRTYEVTFLGVDGPEDDVSIAPLRRSRKRVDVRVPLGAVAGPVLVAGRHAVESAPTEAALAIHPAAAPAPRPA